MKVYIVCGEKFVYGVYTDEKKATEKKEAVNRSDYMGGGYGHVACVIEKEVK